MASVVIRSDSEDHSVMTSLDYDADADVDVKLVSVTGASNVMASGTEEEVERLIGDLADNETRDDIGGKVIETVDERENVLSNKANEKEKKKKKKPRKSRRNITKAEGAVDTKDVISTLNKNITTARHHKKHLTDNKTLISPRADNLIDNLINTCDPLFEASYKATCDSLFKLEVGNEELADDRDDDTNNEEEYDQLQTKLDKILSLAELHGVSSEKEDDAQDYDNFDLNGVSALVNQKREIDDLIVSKGLVDAELEGTKTKLRDAMNAMKLLQQSNAELQESVRTLQSRLSKKDKNAEHAKQKEQEMSQNYLDDLDKAHSTIEHLERTRQDDLINHRKAVADLTMNLNEETQNNEHLMDEILMLKQQLVAERSKRHCVEELIHEKDKQNEQLRSELHEYAEMEQTTRIFKKETRKVYKHMREINENLNSKLSSSKEKLKTAKRERNELQMKLMRLNNLLRLEADTRANFIEKEPHLKPGDIIEDENFLHRQSQRIERMRSIMS